MTAVSILFMPAPFSKEPYFSYKYITLKPNAH